MECGFSDSRYLNKLFVQRFGCSAKEYRSRLERQGSSAQAEPVPTVAAGEQILTSAQSLAWLKAHQAAASKEHS